jgi:two-component system, NarL family, nitrate/nitrite response regulator NarL
MQDAAERYIDRTSEPDEPSPATSGFDAAFGSATSTGAGEFMQRSSDAVPSSRSSRRRRLPAVIPTVLVDESILFRTGLAHILSTSRFRVKAGAARFLDLPESTFSDPNTLVLVSIEENEHPATLQSMASLINNHKKAHMVALSNRFCPRRMIDTLNAGAHGYLLKDEISPEALVASLELILSGALVIPRVAVNMPSVNHAVATPVASIDTGGAPAQPAAQMHGSGLSTREEMIVEQLMRGASNKHIARSLNIAEATVKVHVKSVLRKIGVNNRTQAAIWGFDRVRPNGVLQK